MNLLAGDARAETALMRLGAQSVGAEAQRQSFRKAGHPQYTGSHARGGDDSAAPFSLGAVVTAPARARLFTMEQRRMGAAPENDMCAT